MRSVEAYGGTIDLAISRALAALGAERDDVHVEILEGASPGVLGIGRRTARVRATMRPPIEEWLAIGTRPAESVSPQGAEGRSSRGGRAARDEGGRGTTRDGRHPVNRRGDVSGERDGEAGSGADAVAPDPAVLVWEIFRHLVDEVTVVESGELDVPGEARLESVPTPRLLSVVGKDVDGAIGRKGEVLEAVEYVVNRVLDHARAGQRVALDAPGYRVRRRAVLEEYVRRMAARARARRRAVTLDPMGPGDRGLVAELLQGDRSLSVRSVGHGFYRKQMLTAGGTHRGAGKKSP